MWESANLDSPPGGEPDDAGRAAGGRVPDRADAAPVTSANGSEPEADAATLRGTQASPYLQRSAERVFSALAMAGTPPAGGSRGTQEGGEPGSDGWSADALAARERARQRWQEAGVGPAGPSPPEPRVDPAPAGRTTEEAPPAGPEPRAAASLTGAAAAPWLPAQGPGRAAVATSFGPPGRRRSPVAVMALSVLSLGFYALWWHHRVNREMAEFDPRMTVDAERSTWAVTLPLLAGWLLAAAAVARYLLALGGTPTADLPFSPERSLVFAASPLAVPYLELLLPFSLVAILMTHERARVVEDRVGVATDRQLRPVAALSWLLVPVVGGLVGMARMQRHLNEVWASVTA
jgi:hypothetical protein